MIEFSDHALRKIEQRHLKKEWVLQVLDKPDQQKESYGSRVIAYRKIGKLYLTVVYKKEKTMVTIITAHWEKGFVKKKEV